MSAWSCRSTDGKADQQIVPPRPRIPRWKGPGADSEEKHEPASDIDTALMDSLKVLDPEGPIREADMVQHSRHFAFVPIPEESFLGQQLLLTKARTPFVATTLTFSRQASP